MGIPTNTSNPSTSSTAPQPPQNAFPTNPQQQAQPSPSPDSLPPEALDLAAKLFDLARTGTTPTLTQYIEAGIPPNLTNSTGDSLLMLAAYHGHVETVRMLLQKGADPNVLNARGQNPMAGATFKGYDHVVRLLFENGGDKDGGRPTAVETARIFKREDLLRLFGWVEGVSVGSEVPAGVPSGRPGNGSL